MSSNTPVHFGRPSTFYSRQKCPMRRQRAKTRPLKNAASSPRTRAAPFCAARGGVLQPTLHLGLLTSIDLSAHVRHDSFRSSCRKARNVSTRARRLHAIVPVLPPRSYRGRGKGVSTMTLGSLLSARPPTVLRLRSASLSNPELNPASSKKPKSTMMRSPDRNE